jgi:DNA-binding GntR family transcriptional regulator
MTQSVPSGFDLAPLARPGPLRTQVKDALIELIISQQLAPGLHLVESEIAGRLQVSRQPVREALQSLETEGWIDLRPGRGAFVHEPTDDEVDEVFEVRVTLEEKSAALAARNATAEQVAELRQVCLQGRRAVRDGDVATVVERNATLHRRISAMSDNRVLAGFVASLDRRVRWYFTPIATTRGISSWDEHDQLLDALEARDSRGAAKVMRAHTARSQRAYHEARRRGIT